MEQLKVYAHQTVRLDLDFDQDMRGHALTLKALFHIGRAVISWIDDANGKAEIHIPTGETATWKKNSSHRLTIATVAENGDVEVWGSLELRVII